jgi:hypothetical protein
MANSFLSTFLFYIFKRNQLPPNEGVNIVQKSERGMSSRPNSERRMCGRRQCRLRVEVKEHCSAVQCTML